MQLIAFARYAAKALEILAVLLVAAIVVVITGSVVLRMFGVVPSGSTELATLLFTWAIYIGLILAFLEGGHLAITALVSRLTGRVETLVLVLADVMLLVFLAVVAVEGFTYVGMALDSVRLTPSLKISPAWQYSAVLVGMLLSAVFILTRAVVNMRQLVRGEPALDLHTRRDDDLESV